MNTKQTLKGLFESRKEELVQKLADCCLPRDAEKVHFTVTNHLNELFDSNNDFRQNLTQSEDYILQAAMSLLNAQQEISSALTKDIAYESRTKKTLSSSNEEHVSGQSSTINSTYSFVGAAGGALAGKLIFGGWGAVFGAITGVALSLYLSNKNHAHSVLRTDSKPVKDDNPNKPIDVVCFIDILYKVCESVDNLIDTFRAQVNRVVQKYETQEKPSLDKDYRPLIETIQTLVGYERYHDIEDEKYSKKLKDRIEDLVESLDTYDITLVNYSEEKSSWFDKVASPNTSALKEIHPAVVKKDTLIIPGKVFVPA